MTGAHRKHQHTHTQTQRRRLKHNKIRENKNIDQIGLGISNRHATSDVGWPRATKSNAENR